MAPSGVRLCASLLLLNLKHRERAEAIRAEAHDDSRFQVPGFGMEGFGGGGEGVRVKRFGVRL